ncbi:MAG: pyruvate formate-lyase, partial [Lachnospiraceae bacterium]|nr:pyruvate formate-lyase [Lachnospiraceae bacterium]
MKGADTSFYTACLRALDTLSRVFVRYAEEAGKTGRKELEKALFRTSEQPPETFLEALQLAWLYSLKSGVLNYGRMDDYLGDFLERDLQAGRITDEEATRLLVSLWELIDARKTVFHGRVIIGGRGRHNEPAANHFAMLAMEATNRRPMAEPQLSLRFYEGQDPALYEKALDVIGQGKIYPMLYNDDVNIPSVERAFGVSEEEARDYCFFGCGEYVINHKSTGSPNGIINLLKVLELTLENGRDLYDGKEAGLKLGRLTDFESFDELYEAYKKQLVYYIRMMAELERLEYDYCGKVGEYLYISMLMDDCLSRGKGLLSGGVHYLGGTLETYGNVNTGNSLYAIKKLVYEDRKISAERLLEALEADFEGFDAERKMLLDCAKFGNDEDEVDALQKDLHEFVCNTVRDLAAEFGLWSYMIVLINNEANTVLGRFTWASADGRKAKEPMANANNPAGGTDRNGATAMLNSLVKLRTDIHAGAVQNMTFSKELFQEERPVLRALLGTYSKNGGAQAMINVLSRGELLDAIR